jgi:MarR family transcriptional regulator, 2-MHQ and catechol-resistance regulon repressor
VRTVAQTPDLASACPSTDGRVVLFGLLLETNARLERQLGAALEDATGLPLAWFEVLLRIHRAEGGFLSMTSLATQTVYSSGGTTRLIDRIEAQGLVARFACPQDRRSVHVRLTELGQETLTRALAEHVAHLDEFVTSKLTEAERDGLETALQKLNGGPPACAGAVAADELAT